VTSTAHFYLVDAHCALEIFNTHTGYFLVCTNSFLRLYICDEKADRIISASPRGHDVKIVVSRGEVILLRRLLCECNLKW